MDLLDVSKRADETDHPFYVAQGHVAMYGRFAVREGSGAVHDRRSRALAEAFQGQSKSVPAHSREVGINEQLS